MSQTSSVTHSLRWLAESFLSTEMSGPAQEMYALEKRFDCVQTT
jgi:hypothetical protein